MKVIRLIGRGGFGNVELIEYKGNHFARKTFSPNQVLDPGMLENVRKRFLKEVRVQLAIKHPNIVEIVSHDLGHEPPAYYMNVADGNLDDDLRNDATLGGHFLSAISDIVAGLEELHSMQIYHRDLKPRNVLRFQLPSGDAESKSVYQICDFGLISMSETALSGLTTTGMVKGSDYYTAPEIAKNLKNASSQSDIYSLGCILHDMVGTEDRVPCGEINEPGPFSAILRGCTRSDPSKRFKTARSVLDAILTVEFLPTHNPSAESQTFIEALQAGETLDHKFWDGLLEFLEVSSDKSDHHSIFGQLSSDQILHLCSVNPIAANQIGVLFANWIATTAFNFELCDALSNRLDKFFEHTTFDSKIECLLAMLELGTSHNRWFVERKFVRLTAPDMDLNLAKRLAVEFMVEGEEICTKIDHLENSIGFSRASFHPVLLASLSNLCS